MKTVASVKTWLGRLSETTQRLLLAGLLGDGQLQPAKAADLLQRLRELVEARGAQQLAERLSYHVHRGWQRTGQFLCDLNGTGELRAT
jgi:hypothetical protein